MGKKFKKIDLLKQLYKKEISGNKAYELFSEARDADAPNSYKLLSMDNIEVTAFLHSAPLKVIAKWRFQGWPNRCIYSGEEITPENFGWLAVSKNGKYGLCLIKNLSNFKKANGGSLDS
jgi:hypothetical protein